MLGVRLRKTVRVTASRESRGQSCVYLLQERERIVHEVGKNTLSHEPRCGFCVVLQLREVCDFLQ